MKNKKAKSSFRALLFIIQASGKIGIANCVLPSLNKDITYLLTYLLYSSATNFPKNKGNIFKI